MDGYAKAATKGDSGRAEVAGLAYGGDGFHLMHEGCQSSSNLNVISFATTSEPRQYSWS